MSTTHAQCSAADGADGSRCHACASALLRRRTPLHYAANEGHAAMAATLLTYGADVNAKNNQGCGGRSLFWGNNRRAPRRSGRPGRIYINLGAHIHTHTETHTHTHAKGYM